MKIFNLRKTNSLLLIIFFIFTINSFSNTLFGGIEIGSKGVKITILDVENAKKNIFTLKEFWTENVGIAKGISVDGNLALEDIDAASKIVLDNYILLLSKYKVENQNIFIVASSGVGMAKNTDVLANKIKELTKKELDIISSKLESKLMFRGSVTKKLYLNSLILDIGGGNTKGGFVELKNEDINVFYPFNLNLGTVTLTEKITKTMKDKNDTNEFIDKLFMYNNELDKQVKEMYLERPEFKDKSNIYMTGGAVWAFFVLSGNFEVDNFSEFTYEDVQYYDAVLKNNFKKFTDLSEGNKEAARVLRTYNQKSLIAANAIFMRALENLTDLDNKKLFFVKQGQIAWLLSYVADSAKGAKPIF
jgi:exopolyphosphatase/pppGpp-phosphohydrolase